jgi:hypothetical protein
MKSPLHYFSKALLASPFSSNNNYLTMNISTTQRRWAQGLLMLCLSFVSITGANAQCEDFISFPPGPVVINLTLDGSGNVNLTNAVLNANGFTKNAACDYWLSQTPANLASFNNTPISFDCSDVATSPQTWHVRTGGLPLITDDMGPGATIVPITINVIDNQFPTITTNAGPHARNADAMPAGSCRYTIQPGDAATLNYLTASDNCPNAVIQYNIDNAGWVTGTSVVGQILNGSGAHSIQWRMTDASGNITVAPLISVNVSDGTAPSLTCPAPVITTTDPSNTCSRMVNGIGATYSDNCSVVSVTWTASAPTSLSSAPTGINDASGTTFQLGVTTVTYTASDGVNPPVNCNFTVTVNDNDAPVITCPGNKVENAAGSPACNFTVTDNSYNASATDNCGLIANQPVVVSTPGYNGLTTLNGASFNVGNTVVTWSAADNAGLFSTCSFTVTVNDVTPPTVVALPPGVVSFQSVFNVNTAPGSCSQTVSWYRPSPLTHNATDCSGIITLTENNTVSINCPGLSCNNDPTFFTTNGVTPYPYDATNPLQWVTPVSAEFEVGTTVITYEFTDLYGNITPVTVTVNVAENEPPTANCVATTVSLPVDPFLNSGIVTPALINNGSTDNCGIADMTTDNPATPFDNESVLPCTQLGNNVVTLYVTDNAGNTSTCTATVFLVDNTLPQIGCPATFVVAANANCQATVPGLIFNSTTNFPPSPSTLEYYDNTADPCGLVFDYQVNGGGFVNLGTFTSNPVDLSGHVFTAGNNTVAVRATDDAGNIAVCNFTVNVQDQTPPTLTCPTPMVNPLLIGSCAASATWPNATATDNCPGPITLSSNFPSGFSFPGGTTQVVYTGVDAAGNIGTCSFNVTVVDNQFPVANCKAPFSVNLSAAIGAGSVTVTPAQVDNLSTDNCGYFYVPNNVTYTCANLGTNIYTLTISDAAGNQSTCSTTITVVDNTAPTFNCPANVTVNANAVCQSGIVGTATATDNCAVTRYEYDLNPPAAVNFSLLNIGATGNLANIPAMGLGVTTVTLRALDASGNSSTCTFTVTVRDVTPPVFAGVPANVTVNCDAVPAVTNPTATDNCGSATVVYQGQVFSPGTCLFTITRTWVAFDNAAPSNTITVSQVITVQDVTGPVFNANYLPNPVNINVAGPGICTGNYTLTVTTTGATPNVTDACNGISGITYTLVPASGMSSSGNLTNSAGTYTLPVSSFPIGTNVVTLTASDGCGRTSTKVVNIIVTDNQPPVFSGNYAAAPAGNCGKVYTLPNTTNNCDQLFVWNRPLINEITDCGLMSITETINNASVQSFINLLNPYATNPHGAVTAQFPVGETTITYTATQGANVSTCSFIVKILDTQAPTITCPPNSNLNIATGCAAAATVPTYPPASISDNCINNVVVSQSPAAGTLVSNVVPVVPGNTFTVTLQATDSQPNNLMSAPCSFTVTLIDAQAPQPVISSLPDIVSNCTKDTVFAPAATDCNGTVIETIYGTPSVQVMMILPPLVPGGPPRYVLNPGTYVITWSYTDPQNNTTTQPQNVFITIDNTPPVAIGQPLTVNLNAAGTAFITAAQVNNGSFDPDMCGPIDIAFQTGTGPNFVYVDTLDFDCDNLANNGVNNIVFAAIDINGNVATFPTTVTIKDVTAPSFVNGWTSGQQDTVIQSCELVPPASAFPQTAVDECDVAVNILLESDSSQTASGCTKYSYVINRKWTATDDSGNTTTRTQRIVVTDTQAPEFAANTPAMVTFNTAPNALVCNAAVNFNMADFVTDCQDSVDLTITNTLISAPVGNTFVIPSGANISAPNYPVGTYVIRFTATDQCGNSSVRDLTVEVKDVTPPTAVCINGVSASLQPSGTVTVTVNQFNNNSYDNCSPTLGLLIQRLDTNPLEAPSATLEYDCDDADGVTQHGVKLFVSDQNGNMSTCQTYIVIQDNVAPVITCPPSKTVQCTDILTPAVQGVATAVDNCPIVADSISFTDVISGGVGNICQVLTRTWKVIDLADNVTTCDQLLSIQDTVKPVFTILPPNITVSCSDGSVDVTPVGATDNCDNSVIPVLTVDTIAIAQGDCGLFDYTIVRTWTATDDCGNVAVHTRQIKVVDITEPEFAGMPDTIILNTSQFPPNQSCTVSWNFNVGQFLEDCSPDSIILVTNDSPFGDGKLDLSGNYPIGSYTIFFAAVDACGNVGIDSLYVEVRDNSVPTLVCNNNVVIALGTNGEAILDAQDIDLGSTDNCALDTMVLSQNLFDCGDLGFQSVVLTATDIYGNTNTCAVQVEVTLGNNIGFDLTATGTPETYFGAGDGSATAVATGGAGGPFTFIWNTPNADTTAMVNDLAAGSYIVTATDASSGCIAFDTVMIDEGPKVTITVGTDDGCQGEILSIPVRADNFIEVTAFTFGLELGNGVAGTILGISNVNPVFVGLTAGVNTVLWADPNLNTVNLPNGTVLFNIDIQLSNAAQGTGSDIIEANIPTLEFLQDGTNQAPDVVFNNGSITISCIANDIELAGEVFTWKAPAKAIPDATVELNGTVTGTDITALPNADYNFLVPSGANTQTSVFKIATQKNQQINVGDMLGIQAHAAQQVAFNSGYQWVAADVNGDFRVNLADYALVQKYVLSNNSHFLDNQGNQVGPDWKFIPASFMFNPLPLGNPQAPQPNPLNTPIPPSFITHNNVTMDFLDDDFVGVLMGDVNGSVTFSLTGTGSNENTNALKFRVEDRPVQAGEVVTIPFKAVDFTEAQAYQLTIGFNPEVFELQDIQAGVLPGLNQDNFGTDYLADGLLSTLWVGNKPMSVNDNETLFALTFKAVEAVPSLSSVLHSNSAVTEALAINGNGNTIPVDFEFVTTVSAGEIAQKVFALYQNQPNPFNAETTISFRLPETGRATLRIFTAEGQLVKTVVGEFAEGMNAINFRKDDLGATGVFYYELETARHSDRKKMILID